MAKGKTKIRRKGVIIEKGPRLWNKAKKMIPGGTQLLSKRAEMFLPERWPSYFRKAKGVEIWDLDGNRLTDVSYMGIGACVLGYADPDVNAAAKRAIDAGSVTTLNCPEEVELAELLLKLHPWAGMVRYTRSGGEAMVVAVRIARAHTGKDKVAFCGYHGWHDWYLSANLADDKNLDGHLLPGLDPKGVPRCLIGTALPFSYNKIEELENIVSRTEDIGVIVVEPVRHHEPKDNFLAKVRRIADGLGAVLIFDEITTGWRMRVGGIHELYGVRPDIAVYAKAMSNGFPMGAVVGKSEVMDAAQESFISSTNWTDRIGPAASIATINKLIAKDVPSHLCKIGNSIRRGWEELGEAHGLKLEVMGIAPQPVFAIDHKDSQALHTLFTQEMLQRGFLATKAISTSYSHKKEHVTRYLGSVDEVFGIMSEAIRQERIYDLLKGPPAHVGFKRLA